MKIWIDAHLSPSIAAWINRNYSSVSATSFFKLGSVAKSDREIFFEARAERAIILTKDDDFVQLLEILGAPPCIIWLRIGNSTNRRVRKVLALRLTQALELFEEGIVLVEITDKSMG